MAFTALGLVTMAERLTCEEPAALDVSGPPGPSVQEVALWDGKRWQLIELSLN